MLFRVAVLVKSDRFSQPEVSIRSRRAITICRICGDFGPSGCDSRRLGWLHQDQGFRFLYPAVRLPKKPGPSTRSIHVDDHSCSHVSGDCQRQLFAWARTRLHLDGKRDGAIRSQGLAFPAALDRNGELTSVNGAEIAAPVNVTQISLRSLM